MRLLITSGIISLPSPLSVSENISFPSPNPQKSPFELFFPYFINDFNDFTTRTFNTSIKFYHRIEVSFGDGGG